ncbi:hypothetical protein HDU87_005740 [Geranomyces variabilis]|uniref:TAP42-like protein n=1 Tax=Geranomyces variabilis TaxID=109894 RepID=A0AAD5XLG2_9FUNG|nr:hypothetical protein HDU87_005740 [Geranomyces variabilis]
MATTSLPDPPSTLAAPSGSGVTDESRSLRAEFARGRALYTKLEDSQLSSSDPQFQKDAVECIASLTRCSFLVRQLGVFSRNETAEDVNTADLRYLLIDVYAAETMTKLVTADRDATLLAAEKLYESFLASCDHMDILDQHDKRYLDDHIRIDGKDSLVPGTVTTGQSMRALDPERRRNERIARFKREKSTRAKLKQLQTQIAHQAKPNESDRAEDDDADWDNPGADEELLRSLTLTTIDLFIQTSLDALKILHDERALLAAHRARSSSGTSASSSSNADAARLDPQSTRPTQHTGPLMSDKGKILRPFTITPAKDRGQVAKGVFGYGHNLPTMSVDTFLDLEMERGNFLQGGGAPPEKIAPDDNDEAAADAATYKAREWDEFKDYTPAGWGNRHNKG